MVNIWLIEPKKNLQNNQLLSLLLYHHAVLNESESSDIVILYAALSLDIESEKSTLKE